MEYSVSPCLTLWWTTAADVSGAAAWRAVASLTDDVRCVVLGDDDADAEEDDSDADFDFDSDDFRFDATLVSRASLAPGVTGRWTSKVFLPARLSPFRRFQLRIILAETPRFSATDSTVSPLRIL